jgi:hypothetical protein
MSYLGIALVSFALLLVNLAIGALAHKGVRAQIVPVVRRALRLGRNSSQ